MIPKLHSSNIIPNDVATQLAKRVNRLPPKPGQSLSISLPQSYRPASFGELKADAKGNFTLEAYVLKTKKD